MGATDFTHTAKGKTAREAFAAAVAEARHDHGHGGYTGTIAEKRGFVVIPIQDGASVEDAHALARRLIDEDDPRISNKWGPPAASTWAMPATCFSGGRHADRRALV